MKRLLYLLFFIVIITIGCTNGNTNSQTSDADSIYQWEYIRQYLNEEPEYALRLLDTAEMKGLDVNQANFYRSVIYYNSPKLENFDKAREYALKVLNNRETPIDSQQYIKTIVLLVNILAMDAQTYQEAIRYAMEGVQRAHNAGDVVNEADLYYQLGHVMDYTEMGSGLSYMERSLDVYRKAARDSVRLLPMLSIDLANAARRYASMGNSKHAMELLNERLQVIDRIEKEIPTAPKGYCQDTRARTYALLAFCQWHTGDLDRAKKTAEAFEQVKDILTPIDQYDIMVYYAFSGNGERMQQYFDRLEPLIREKEDTISHLYVGLLETYAAGLDKIGRYQEAYKTLDRRNTLNDSLLSRTTRMETLKFAQQMKTQEKEIELREKETEGRIHLIIIISLTVLLIVSIIFLWRITLAKQRLHEKNRQLFETVQQMIKREEYRLLELSEQPADSLSATQLLYNRICKLMREKQLYTDSDLNRESLANELGTNYNVVAAAIKECADGQTIGDFLDDWRARHAAALLRDTDNTIGLIIEQSGFASRSHFSSLFREKFKMTPSEYRKIATEKNI